MKTANQRLKERWSACLVGSMLLALIVHLALALAIPPWEFPLRQQSRNRTTAFVQLIPMAASSELMQAEREFHPSLSPSPAVQPESVDQEPSSEPLVPVWDPVMTVEAAPPIESRLSTARVSVRPPVGPTNLHGMAPPIAWPEITNPERMIEYIRARYNPVLAENGVTGTVVLSLRVDERGVVAGVGLSEPSGSAILDEIAVTTFEEVVTFSPARDGPRALAVQFTVSVPFLTAW